VGADATMSLFSKLVPCILALLGIACWVVPWFLYEDAEGRIRNRLVDWWVSVTTIGEVITRRHVVITRAIAEQSLRAIDFFFGKKPLSVRLIWTSLTLSEAAGYVSMILAIRVAKFVVEHSPAQAECVSANPDWDSVLLGLLPQMAIVASGFAALALVPLLFDRPIRSKRNIPAILLPVLACALVMPEVTIIYKQTGIINAVVLPAAWNIAAIWVIRALLRRTVRAKRFGVATLVAIVIVPLLLVIWPLRNAIHFDPGAQLATFVNHIRFDKLAAMQWLMLNSIAVIVALCEIGFSLLLAANLLFWPFLSNAIYALHTRPPTRIQLRKLGLCFIAIACAIANSTSIATVLKNAMGISWADATNENSAPMHGSSIHGGT